MFGTKSYTMIKSIYRPRYLLLAELFVIRETKSRPGGCGSVGWGRPLHQEAAVSIPGPGHLPGLWA